MNEQTLLGGAQPAPVPYATYARLLEQVRELRDETHIAACDFFIGHGACPAYEVVTIRLDAILAAETPAPEPTPSIIAADRLEARAVNHRNAGRKDLAEALEQAARDRRTIEEANSIVTKALWGIERPHGDELAASIRALVALAAQREPVAAPAERPTTFGQWASKITQHGSDVPQINVIGRPAETPTGLAPLLTMSEREYGPDGVSVRWQVWDEQIRRLWLEIDAQRHARASERRQAIEECAAVARRTWHGRWNWQPSPDAEVIAKAIEALRDQPRVSPGPQEGGKP